VAQDYQFRTDEWKPKDLPHERFGWLTDWVAGLLEVPAMECGGTDSLAEGQEVKINLHPSFNDQSQVTLESPGFPQRYPNNADCIWNIEVPAGDEVDIWCETFHIRQGDSLEVGSDVWFPEILPPFQVVGVFDAFYGQFDDGVQTHIEASDAARTLQVQFKSNSRGRGSGFKCELASVPASNGTGTG
jgi:hypothetical protein